MKNSRQIIGGDYRGSAWNYCPKVSVLLIDIHADNIEWVRIIIYPFILDKLEIKHGVSAGEVEQLFLNRTGFLAKETRAQNQGDEDRFWFISSTDEGRELKVVFFMDVVEKVPVIITAYEPDENEVNLYEKIERQKKK